MRHRRLIFLLFVILLNMSAQERERTTGWLSISSLPTGADTYVNSFYLGKTPLDRIELAAGKHVVRAFYPSLTSWNAISKVDSVVVVGGHETTISWEFGSLVSLTSVPSGSSVSYEGRQLGVTPFFYMSSQELHGNFLLQKEGFEPAQVGVSGSGYFGRTVRLDRVNAKQEQLFLDVLSLDSNGETADQWMNYVAGSAMIVSGFLAAYYKDHANRNFDNYQEFKDPAMLNSVRRFDKLSGISFTITQLSFGILAYKLLLE